MKTEFEETENEALRKTAVKCRFFAQYWGQEVKGFDDKEPVRINSVTISLISNSSHLKLKSVENISDDDALQIAFLGKIEKAHKRLLENKNRTISNVKRYQLTNLYSISVVIIDFLRSKGYAVPFMEYSVEELVKMGWVQLV